MMMNCRLFCLILSVLLLLGTTLAASKEFVLNSEGETIQFTLNLDRIAVGFNPSLSASDRTALLESLESINDAVVERDAPALSMAVVRLSKSVIEEDIARSISELEHKPGVSWAAPVLLLDGLEHIVGPRLYVQFERNVNSFTRQALLDRYGLSDIQLCDDWATDLVWVKRPKNSGWTALDLCRDLGKESGVAWVCPDFNRVVRANTNDTFYNNQWFLNQVSDADIDAPQAWSYTTGSASIVVSICDVGVQITHPDLNDKIETGYDASDGDSNPDPESGDDGHGTCCAGLAAAETNNSAGVAGVSYNCHLLGTKMGYIIFGGFIQTNDTWIINCINYSRDHSDVMSNSWGGGASSGAVNTALTNAKNAGLTILFASGNSNSSVQWPATQISVIAVGATNEADDRCDPGDWGGGQGSNFGSQLDIVAPGNNTYTTDMTGTNGYSNGDYDPSFGGTSAACPIAAGVCALILSVDPSLTPAQVQTVLQSTADDLVGAAGEDVAGWDQYMGWGRVNANDAVLYVFGAPSNLLATSGQVSIPLTWSTPWRTPSSYDIYRSTTGQFGAYSVIGNSAVSNFTDTNVLGGVTYWYKVKAVYTNGQSDFSNAASAIPAEAYLPPQNLVATGGADSNVPVQWQLPASGTPIRYDLYRSTTGEFGAYSVHAQVNHPTTSYTDLAVTNGSEYWYKAKAVYSGPNESGFSNSDSATPAAPPNSPPVLMHDALDDFAPGSGVITALASDTEPLAFLSSVTMFFRLIGAGSFDSTTLSATGNLQEYSASLASLAAGSYEYFVRAADNLGVITTVPPTAPAELYTFDVYPTCANELAYDDGTSERYNYTSDEAGVPFLWAVKFGPVATPYALCGARVAVARSIPDTDHTPIYFAVLLADGIGGLPGTVILEGTTGSIGNDIGGIPLGTNWAQMIFKDAFGDPIVLNASEFYIAVSNVEYGKTEAFGRDTDGLNAHVSLFFDPCEDAWFSEDDPDSPNAYPGNRMIRAQGFSLTPPTIVIHRSGNDAALNWTNTGAPLYRIYSATSPIGPFTTVEGSSETTEFLDIGAVASFTQLFYEVRSVIE